MLLNLNFNVTLMYFDLITYSSIFITLVHFYFKKPSIIRLALASMYGLLYLIYCAYLLNTNAFDFVCFIIFLITCGMLYLAYRWKEL